MNRITENKSCLDLVRKFIALYVSKQQESKEKEQLLEFLLPVITYQRHSWSATMEAIKQMDETELNRVRGYLSTKWNINVEVTKKTKKVVTIAENLISGVDDGADVDGGDVKQEENEANEHNYSYKHKAGEMGTVFYSDNKEDINDAKVATVMKTESNDNDDDDDYDQNLHMITFNLDNEMQDHTSKPSFSIENNLKRSQTRIKHSSVLEVVYTFFVEALSIADLYTDALVLFQLMAAGQQWWSSLMLLAILAPYIVSYSALGALLEVKVSMFESAIESSASEARRQQQLAQYRYEAAGIAEMLENEKDNDETKTLQDKAQQNEKNTVVSETFGECCCYFITRFMFYCLMVLTCTPLCLGYFILLDVVFAAYSVIFSGLYLLTFGNVSVAHIAEDYFFTKVLGLTRMELIGYRRLRTLSQLLFETFPQIVLSAIIISTINNSDRNSDAFKGINENALYVSVLFALLHVLFEGMMIYLDSRACYIPFWQYAIICLNARLNWVPYSHILMNNTIITNNINNNNNNNGSQSFGSNFICNIFNKNNGDSSLIMEENKSITSGYLNFEAISASIMCLKYKLDYEFSALSFKKFETYIASLSPFSRNSKKEKTSGSSSNENNSHDDMINVRSLILPLQEQWKMKSNGNIKQSRNSNIFRIMLGMNVTNHLSLDALSRMFRFGANKCIFDTHDVSFKRILYNSRRVIRQAEQARYMFDNLLQNGELNMANSILSFVLAFRTNQNAVDGFSQAKCKILANMTNNMLVLKQYWQYNVYFGMNCKESEIIYRTVYKLVKQQLKINYNRKFQFRKTTTFGNEPNFNKYECFYFALLILWYTQRGDFVKHKCFECNKTALDHMYEYALNDVTLPDVDENEENDEKNKDDFDVGRVYRGATMLNVLGIDGYDSITGKIGQFVKEIKRLQSNCTPKRVVFKLGSSSTDTMNIDWKYLIRMRLFDSAVEQYYLSKISNGNNISNDIIFNLHVESIIKDNFTLDQIKQWFKLVEEDKPATSVAHDQVSIMFGKWVNHEEDDNNLKELICESTPVSTSVDNGHRNRQVIEIGQNIMEDHGEDTIFRIKSIHVAAQAKAFQSYVHAVTSPQRVKEKKDEKEDRKSDNIADTDDDSDKQDGDGKDDAQDELIAVANCYIEIWYPIRLVRPRNLRSLRQRDLKLIETCKQFIHSPIRTEYKPIKVQMSKSNQLNIVFGDDAALTDFDPILSNYASDPNCFGHYCVNNKIRIFLCIESCEENQFLKINNLSAKIKFHASSVVNYPFNVNKSFESQNDLEIIKQVEEYEGTKNDPTPNDVNLNLNVNLQLQAAQNQLKNLQNTGQVKKILLLGAGFVGKSTIFKQLRLLHRDGWSDKDRNAYKDHIFSQIIESMKALLEGMEQLKEEEAEEFGHLKFSNEEAEKAAVFMDKVKSDADVDEDFAKKIDILWREEAIMAIFEERHRLRIDDSGEYFFDSIFRIGDKSYIPTDLDILMVAHRTTGIVEQKFEINKSLYHVFDTGR